MSAMPVPLCPSPLGQAKPAKSELPALPRGTEDIFWLLCQKAYSNLEIQGVQARSEQVVPPIPLDEPDSAGSGP
jgi:hypothetical protein